MKTRILITVMLFLHGFVSVGSMDAVQQASTEKSIKVCVTPETRNLAETWVTGYNKINQDVTIDLNQISLAEFKEEINTENSVGIIMQRPDVALLSKSMWHLTIGRDVIVAVIHEKNPFAETLASEGVSVKDLSELAGNQGPKTWETILSNGSNQSISIVIEDGPEIKIAIAKFLDVDPTMISFTEKNTAEDFLSAVRNDIYSVGFCHLTTIIDPTNHDFIQGVKLLPLDKNNNRHIDYNENFYTNPEQLVRSVWIGKYPRALVYNIYAIAPAFPENKELNDFLNWVTTSGQEAVEQNGYTDLVYSEKQSNLEKLTPASLFAENESGGTTRSSVLFWVIMIVLIVGLLFAVVLYSRRTRQAKAPLVNKVNRIKLLNNEALNFPKGLYFDKSHTWVFMEKGGQVRLGIDDFISNVTGNYTRVILKSPGEKVKRMEPVVTLIRKGKQIFLNSPVSGTIKEINESLVDDPSTINNAPYGDGWLYKVEPSNWLREIQFFKMGESYREWINLEFNRLKDFLACSLNIKNMEEGKLAFQEGGELVLHPLKELDPKVWEDFQNYFINTADMY